METALVWVLVVSYSGSNRLVEQLGSYATLTDCTQIQQSAPLASFSSQCVHVKIPVVSQDLAKHGH